MRDMRTEIAEYRSDSKDAVEVANAVRKFMAVAPICVLVRSNCWWQMDDTDEVESLDMRSEIPTLDDLKKKKVIFVHYAKEEELQALVLEWMIHLNDSVVEFIPEWCE